MTDSLDQLPDAVADPPMTPDPVFARFYYSHPPASERIARLQGAAA